MTSSLDKRDRQVGRRPTLLQAQPVSHARAEALQSKKKTHNDACQTERHCRPDCGRRSKATSTKIYSKPHGGGNAPSSCIDDAAGTLLNRSTTASTPIANSSSPREHYTTRDTFHVRLPRVVFFHGIFRKHFLRPNFISLDRTHPEGPGKTCFRENDCMSLTHCLMQVVTVVLQHAKCKK